MLQKFLADSFETALLQLKNEINAYTHKEHVWQVSGQIANSGGTLALHLLGNLNHFIGAGLAHNGYVRHREKEFTERNVPTGELMKQVDEVSYLVKETVSNLTDEQLFAEYPIKDSVPGKMTAERLIFLLAHLNYHVGQINYHRRLLDQPVSLPDDVQRIQAKTGKATI